MVYSRPGCVQCPLTYRALGQAGIAYQSVDVSHDEQALERIEAMGFRQVPVVVAGDECWAGFRPDRIAGLAAHAPRHHPTGAGSR